MTKKDVFEKLPKVKFTGKSRTVLVSHNDLDGVVPAILLGLMQGNLEVYHVGNDVMSERIRFTIEKNIYSADNIIITDISCNEQDAEVADNIIKRAKESGHKHANVVLLDHHTSSASHMNKYDWAVEFSEIIEDSFRANIRKFNSREVIPYKYSSATALLFDYLDYIDALKLEIHPDKYGNMIREMVQLTSSYDMRDEITRRAFALNDLLYLYGINIFKEMFLDRFGEAFLDIDTSLINTFDLKCLFINERKTDEKIECLRNKYRYDKIKLADGKIYKCVYIFNSWTPSKVLEDMKKTYPDAEIYINIGDTAISLRRNDSSDIDLSKIAILCGGGGHPGASGVTIPFEKKLDLMIDMLNAEIINEEL